MPSLEPDIIAAYRPRAAALSTRISSRIAHEIDGFAAPRTHKTIAEVIHRAVELFIDSLAGAPASGRDVYETYRSLGEIEARADHTLDAMRGAHHIATQESWRELRHACAELDLAADIVGSLGDALIRFQDHLYSHALDGYNDVVRDARRIQARSRIDLTAALLSHRLMGDIARMARKADWAMPPEVAVASTTATPEAARLTACTRSLLSYQAGGRLSVIGATSEIERAAPVLVQAARAPLALSWGVEVSEVADAHRWTNRLLDLIVQGTIDAGTAEVIRCCDHQGLLTLHADPALRRHADRAALAPLNAESTARRLALAETMLLWLRTGHSAPRLAEQLGVHHQTVRHRLRRIKDLFGERLNDPTETVGLLTALESATPRWRQQVCRR